GGSPGGAGGRAAAGAAGGIRLVARAAVGRPEEASPERGRGWAASDSRATSSEPGWDAGPGSRAGGSQGPGESWGSRWRQRRRWRGGAWAGRRSWHAGGGQDDWAAQSCDDPDWHTAGDGPAIREVVLIGIAGPSGVGKTTLARSLVKHLESPVDPVGMDWFLVPQWMPKDKEDGERIWESPDGVDFARLRRELRRAAAVLAAAERLPESMQLGG
ncbi:unnamed protein product, partial [Prorocentrum cordatum]